jgi:hypothetical protein
MVSGTLRRKVFGFDSQRLFEKHGFYSEPQFITLARLCITGFHMNKGRETIQDTIRRKDVCQSHMDNVLKITTGAAGPS